MLYADDACMALRYQLVFAKILEAIVGVCAAFGLIVAEKMMKSTHMRSPTMQADVIEVEAAGQT